MTPVFRGREADFDEWLCPYCDSKDLHREGSWTTLEGWGGGPDEDPNHWTCECVCKACKQSFARMWVKRGKKIWYVSPWSASGSDFAKVLRGVAGCCQTSYANPCECGGWMRHSAVLDGKSGALGFKAGADGRWGPCQPMYFQCISCGKKVEDPKYPGFMERGTE